MRSGSGSTRTIRRAPPTTFAWAALGMVESSLPSTSPTLRNWPGVCSGPCRVNTMKGTSSMVCSLTMGFMAPCGSISGLVASSWWTFTRLVSWGSFTLKRTVMRAMPGRLML